MTSVATKTKRDDRAAPSLVNDDDLFAATLYWHNHITPAYKGMLDGVGWGFDEKTQTYVSDTGTRLSDDDLAALAMLFMGEVEIDLEQTSKKLAEGKIEPREWRSSIDQTLQDEFLILMMIGVGGRERVTDADINTVMGRAGTLDSEGELGYGLHDAMARMDRFEEDVRQRLEDQEDGDGTGIIARSGDYAGGGWTVFQESRRNSHGRGMDETGTLIFTHERNILDDAAEHCHGEEYTAGCPELSELGWVPIGSLPAPGLRTCSIGCKCWLEYSRLVDLP